VVLCAYLGQLARVRDALGSEVAVIIDGHDKEDLAEREEEDANENDGIQVEHVQVTKRVSGWRPGFPDFTTTFKCNNRRSGSERWITTRERKQGYVHLLLVLHWY
jgi:hypothetical protein